MSEVAVSPARPQVGAARLPAWVDGLWLVVTVAGVAAVVRQSSGPVDTALSALLVIFVVAAARIDMASARIPNALTYPAFVVTLILITVVAPGSVGNALLGAAVVAGPMLLAALAVPGGLGMGDVKMLAVAGLALGFPGSLFALAAGIVLAGLFSIVGLAIRRLHRKQKVPLGPFLALGIIYTLAQVGSILAQR